MYFVSFLIVLIVYVALVLGKSISPLKERVSYLILPLEDCASYLNDKCLIRLQKEEQTHVVKYCLECEYDYKNGTSRLCSGCGIPKVVYC
ncbi:hypothetical protein GIB67_013628 [Kingdonia uniflora]|uniref:Uncharacterized protein n=1 Tax=Kingdonia uniflora TaxID=39325 RepID=A0A7J7NQJ5_9MAGN|nr:hypothetical protein GIB67_013628 [Kingdonia uniflora]